MKETDARSFMFYRADSSRGGGMIINTLIQMLSPLTAIKFSLIISQFKDLTILYSQQFSGSTERHINPLLLASELFLLRQPTVSSDKASLSNDAGMRLAMK